MRCFAPVSVCTDAGLVRGATGGDDLKDAAWYYPDTKETAEKIKGYVAFCKATLLAYNDAPTDLAS